MRSRKYLIVLAVVFLVASSANARMVRRGRRSLIELGPKASLYIGDDTNFGIGLETIFNPVGGFGLRLNLAELIFDNTTLYLNFNESLDALFYYPMSGLDTYFHAGFGLISFDTGQGSTTIYSIRGGIGFNHRLNRTYDLFVEPGLIITGNGNSDVVFRLSAGVKFGVLK